MKFSFRPVEGAFYELFSRAAHNLVKGTALLNELALPGVDVQSVSDRLTDVEHDSDQDMDKFIPSYSLEASWALLGHSRTGSDAGQSRTSRAAWNDWSGDGATMGRPAERGCSLPRNVIVKVSEREGRLDWC